MTKTNRSQLFPFPAFQRFEFVSDFGFRISDFPV